MASLLNLRRANRRQSQSVAHDDALSGAVAARPRWATLRAMPYLIRFCVLVLAIFVVAAALAPVISPHDPSEQSLVDRLAKPVGMEGGSTAFLFGTDQLGRDILSRVMHGARVSLGIAIFGMTVGLVIGTTLGVIAGYNGGAIDNLLMFFVDAQQAIPFIIVALATLAIFGTDLRVLLALVGLAGWDSFARFSRGMTLSVRQSQYVLASQALGASQARLITRHILPNVAAPLIVLATLNITGIILLESSLSFLGIGVQPPRPSWGSMIGEGRDYLNTAWWMAVFPGLAVIAVTMSVNMLGDWLRDVLDPTLRGR